MRVRTFVAMLVLFLCLHATGCGNSKLTDENLKKIKLSMSQKEVEEIFGPGREVQLKEILAEFEEAKATAPHAFKPFYDSQIKGLSPISAPKWLEWKGNKRILVMAFKGDKVLATGTVQVY